MKVLLIFIFLFYYPCFGQESSLSAKPPLAESQRRTNLSKQIKFINKTIQLHSERLEELGKAILQLDPDDGANRTRLEAQKSKLTEEIASLYASMEEVATGGVVLSSYHSKKPIKGFDWQEELLEVFKPMISELKALTQRPRAIEAFRTEKAEIEGRLDIAHDAIKRITIFLQEKPSEDLETRLNRFLAQWSQHQEDLSNRLKLIDFKLDELLNPPPQKGKPFWKMAKEFLVGRGLTILLASGAFILSFILFTMASRRLEARSQKKEGEKRQIYRRVLQVSIQFLTLIVSLCASIVVLYSRGDWLILGVILLFLAGVAWGISQSLPRHFQVLKILMNIGPVREGERVIYNGLSWQVKSINMYSTLSNPDLAGGIIRLPINRMVDMISRKSHLNEPWFPSKKGDFVILADGTYGKILNQSPDTVILSVKGGSHKTYPTTEYLDQTPSNISRGFALFITVGLDYALQPNITKHIPNKIKAFLEEQMADEEYASQVLSINCSFKEMAASSLDLMVVASFKGSLAGDYFSLARYTQAKILELCHDNEWGIPFQTITVHKHIDQPSQNL